MHREIFICVVCIFAFRNSNLQLDIFLLKFKKIEFWIKIVKSYEIGFGSYTNIINFKARLLSVEYFPTFSWFYFSFYFIIGYDTYFFLYLLHESSSPSSLLSLPIYLPFLNIGVCTII